MAGKRKLHDDDDGRVIASMNVDGMPWYQRSERFDKHRREQASDFSGLGADKGRNPRNRQGRSESLSDDRRCIHSGHVSVHTVLPVRLVLSSRNFRKKTMAKPTGRNLPVGFFVTYHIIYFQLISHIIFRVFETFAQFPLAQHSDIY